MTEQPTFRLFAYGSNMSTVRLRERTPSARPFAAGRLLGHALRWHKRSKDGSGKCNALHIGSPTECVWGVLFDVHQSEKHVLDKAEGLGHGYRESQADIVTAEGPVSALIYLATDINESLAPYDWYKRHVLVGAREHGLPAEYIADIEHVASCVDPKAERTARNERLY